MACVGIEDILRDEDEDGVGLDVWMETGGKRNKGCGHISRITS